MSALKAISLLVLTWSQCFAAECDANLGSCEVTEDAVNTVKQHQLHDKSMNMYQQKAYKKSVKVLTCTFDGTWTNDDQGTVTITLSGNTAKGTLSGPLGELEDEGEISADGKKITWGKVFSGMVSTLAPGDDGCKVHDIDGKIFSKKEAVPVLFQESADDADATASVATKEYTRRGRSHSEYKRPVRSYSVPCPKTPDFANCDGCRKLGYLPCKLWARLRAQYRARIPCSVAGQDTPVRCKACKPGYTDAVRKDLCNLTCPDNCRQCDVRRVWSHDLASRTEKIMCHNCNAGYGVKSGECHECSANCPSRMDMGGKVAKTASCKWIGRNVRKTAWGEKPRIRRKFSRPGYWHCVSCPYPPYVRIGYLSPMNNCPY